MNQQGDLKLKALFHPLKRSGYSCVPPHLMEALESASGFGFFFWGGEEGSWVAQGTHQHYVTKAGLQFRILLPLLPTFGDSRYVPPHQLDFKM